MCSVCQTSLTEVLCLSACPSQAPAEVEPVEVEGPTTTPQPTPAPYRPYQPPRAYNQQPARTAQWPANQQARTWTAARGQLLTSLPVSIAQTSRVCRGGKGAGCIMSFVWFGFSGAKLRLLLIKMCMWIVHSESDYDCSLVRWIFFLFFSFFLLLLLFFCLCSGYI